MTELIIIRIVRTQRNLTPRFRLDASKIKSCSPYGRKLKDNTRTDWTNSWRSWVLREPLKKNVPNHMNLQRKNNDSIQSYLIKFINFQKQRIEDKDKNLTLSDFY